jgi:hypothetical protein
MKLSRAVAAAVVVVVTTGGLALAEPASAASQCSVNRTTQYNGSATCLRGPGQVRVKLSCYDAVRDSISVQYGVWVNAPGTSRQTCAAGYGTTNYPGGVGYQTR